MLDKLLAQLRQLEVSEDDVKGLAKWNAKAPKQVEVPF